MEMHQVRYFLALSDTLNFTQAAARCNVSQPALTRAIQALEIELGGQLLRRERTLSHLTELGERMVPLMRQCYESAVAMRSTAQSLKRGDAAPLSIAVSNTIALDPFIAILRELSRVVPGLQLKLRRDSQREVVEHLKSGETELAIAGPFAETWSRLETFPLFEEHFDLFVSRKHRLAGRNQAQLGDIASETLLINTECEMSDDLGKCLKMLGIADTRTHQVATSEDMMGLLIANLGVAIMPVSMAQLDGVSRVPLADLALVRKVSAYCVVGRRRAPCCATLLNMLRATEWHGAPAPERLRGVG